jgi:hypothetical protein
MKFLFEIKTEPTLHVAVVIAVAFNSSGALDTIAVSLDSPPAFIYCVTILALIFWVALMKTSP